MSGYPRDKGANRKIPGIVKQKVDSDALAMADELNTCATL